jgi:hypothetical protein
MLTQPTDDSDDEALLRSLVLSEEDCRRRHPEVTRVGGCRWFRSPNVIPLERYREQRNLKQDTG